MEFEEFVSVVLIILGAVCFFLGGRFVQHAAAETQSGRRARPRWTQRATDGAPGVLFVILGAALLYAAFQEIPGPWRHRETGIFPMSILDLNKPPADIEKVEPAELSPYAAPQPRRADVNAPSQDGR